MAPEGYRQLRLPADRRGWHSAPKGTRSPGEAARLHVLRQYQRNAKRNGRAWELTDEDFDELTSSDCFYCGVAPSGVFSTGKYEGADFVYNGIDRVDSSGNYVRQNVVPCCRICNIAKRDMPFGEFLAYVGRLAAHNAPKKAALRVVRDSDIA